MTRTTVPRGTARAHIRPRRLLAQYTRSRFGGFDNRNFLPRPGSGVRTLGAPRLEEMLAQHETALAERASTGRRLIAGCFDLYGFFYVALLPIVVAGAFAFWSEGAAIGRELTVAREVAKGAWWEDPKREDALSKMRGDLVERLFGDTGKETRSFMDGLGVVLLEDEPFKKTLDTWLAHPYTELLNVARKQGVAAFERHLKSVTGSKAVAALKDKLRAAAAARVGDYVRAEVVYRMEQIFRYLGWSGLWKRIEDALRPAPGAKPATSGVPEALHWTALLDRLVSGEGGIGPATRGNMAILRWALLVAAALALLYLMLRDVFGASGSPGKNHAGLMVVDAQTGAPARVGQRVVRGLMLVVLLPLEVVLALVDRRLGDRVAGTRVVRRPH